MLPLPHAGFVYRDLDQPGAEFRFTAKLPQVGKGLQDGFLRHVLRIGVIAQQGQRGRVNPAFVGFNQLGEQRRLSPYRCGQSGMLVVIAGASCSLDIDIRSSIWIQSTGV